VAGRTTEHGIFRMFRVGGAVVIINGVKVLCKNIPKCIGLNEVCTINIQLNGTGTVFSEIRYVFPELLGL
jgi:hypothetical protein